MLKLLPSSSQVPSYAVPGTRSLTVPYQMTGGPTAEMTADDVATAGTVEPPAAQAVAVLVAGAASTEAVCAPCASNREIVAPS